MIPWKKLWAVVLANGLLFACQSPPSEQTAAQAIEPQAASREDSFDQARVALVIGNASYAESKLNNPANDAADMAAMLRDLGFEVVQKVDLQHQPMEEAIRDFGQRLRRAEVGLFYYAGHAVQVDGRNYLIPVGADIRAEKDVKFKSVDLGFLLAELADAGNPLNLVILDACRDNPFRSFRSLSRGLANTEAPTGTLIAFATAPGSVAADGAGRNGTFTRHLLEALQEPGLTLSQVLIRTRVGVLRETNRLQTPWENSSLTGEVVLRPGAAPPPTLQPGDPWTDPAIGMRFRYIPPGTFQMGSPPDEPGRYDRETQHEVTLTRGYWLGETEVTQGQWRQVMGNNPSEFQQCGDDCPVEQVNWYEAVAFANGLSRRAGFAECYELKGCERNAGEDMECSEVVFAGPGCTGYRLPTEAEWERAARAGTETALYTGGLTLRGERTGPELDVIAWYGGNSGVSYAGGWDCSNWKEKQKPSTTCGLHPVGQKQANAWHLEDMLGNVWEWCGDWKGAYTTTAVRDPQGPATGSRRVLRGGSWDGHVRGVRAAYRSWDEPGDSGVNLGFRLARGQGP